MKQASAANIDEYIAGFPPAVQELLQSIRQTIQKTAPAATEKISYQMPAFVHQGNLIYFAAYKNHIGLYPGAAAVAAFETDLQDYRISKGTIQLPLDRPLPLALIRKIVQFRVEENSRKAKIRGNR